MAGADVPTSSRTSPFQEPVVTADVAQPASQTTSAAREQDTQADGMSCIRKRYKQQGFSGQAASLIINSWRPTTQVAYNCYIAKWRSFAQKGDIDLMAPSSADVAIFLAGLFSEGASHSAVDTERSALSAFLPSIEVDQ